MGRSSNPAARPPVRLPMARLGSIPAAASILMICGALFGPSAGCSEAVDFYTKVLPPRGDLVAEGKVKVQAVPGPDVDVSPPTVRRENDDVLIAGTVTRKPDNEAPVSGRLEVKVLDEDRQLVDHFRVGWSPERIPTRGTRSARYDIRMNGLPPRGAIIQVAYVGPPLQPGSSAASVGPPDQTGSGSSAAPPDPGEDKAQGWTPVSSPARQGDVEVRVVSAKVRTVRVKEAQGGTYQGIEPKLVLTIEVKNVSTSVTHTYVTWAGTGSTTGTGTDGFTDTGTAAGSRPTTDPFSAAGGLAATMRDDQGAQDPQAKYGFGDRPAERVEAVKLSPGGSAKDVLVFQPPPANARRLRLELPAENVDGSGAVRFTIPISSVEK